MPEPLRIACRSAAAGPRPRAVTGAPAIVVASVLVVPTARPGAAAIVVAGAVVVASPTAVVVAPTIVVAASTAVIVVAPTIVVAATTVVAAGLRLGAAEADDGRRGIGGGGSEAEHHHQAPAAQVGHAVAIRRGGVRVFGHVVLLSAMFLRP
jgi:hypothetical protein